LLAQQCSKHLSTNSSAEPEEQKKQTLNVHEEDIGSEIQMR